VCSSFSGPGPYSLLVCNREITRWHRAGLEEKALRLEKRFISRIPLPEWMDWALRWTASTRLRRFERQVRSGLLTEKSRHSLHKTSMGSMIGPFRYNSAEAKHYSETYPFLMPLGLNCLL
jgi:hypothetical protein